MTPADTPADPLEALARAIEPITRHADAISESLNIAAESFGFLSRDVLETVANAVMHPLSDVYIVAADRYALTRRPADHTCIVCTGKHCQSNGSAVFIATLADEFDIETGSTSPDGTFGLVRARCLDICGPSPAVILGGTLYDNETPDSIRQIAREAVSADQTDH